MNLPARIHLFQGLPKSDKLELIIQKCTELGVSGIVPVSCKRSVVKLDDKKAAGRIARWQGIAEAAAKQSRRAIIPKVQPIMSLDEALSHAKALDHKLIPYELSENTAATGKLIKEQKKQRRNIGNTL